MDHIPANAERITTQRLSLSTLRVEDADDMADVLSEASLYEFMGGSAPTLTQLRERYEHQIIGASPDGLQRWINFIVRRRDSAEAVGYVQATIEGEADSMTAEIAWVIAQPHQGEGLASEAAAGLVHWLAGREVKHLTAHVHPAHRASERVAENIGLYPTAIVEEGETRWENR